MRARLSALLLLVTLAGCGVGGGGARHVVGVRNDDPRAIEVVLEERHARYPSSVSLPTSVAPGARVELWWDDAFTTEIVVRQGGEEVGRFTLDPAVPELKYP